MNILGLGGAVGHDPATALFIDGELIAAAEEERFKRNKAHALAMLADLGFDMAKTKFQPVEHHLAHASSAYHLSGFKEKTAILGFEMLDGEFKVMGKGYYFSPALIKELEQLRGHGVCLNTSLNRRGDPMVCSPSDALNMLYGSDLQFLIMENILIRKANAPNF